MSVFDWLKIKRKNENVEVGKKICKSDEISSREERTYYAMNEIPPRYRSYEITNIQEMGLKEKSFWKFTQSRPGLSIEDIYEPIEVDKMEQAQTEDEWLSFVGGENIGKCVGYGDRLTELSFDCKDERVNAIKNNLVIKKNNSLGEYATKQLLVKWHYSLEDPETIKKILKMSSPKAIRAFLYGSICNAQSVLEQYGFAQSKNFISYIMKNNSFMYENEILEFKSNIDQIYQTWEYEKARVNPLTQLKSKRIIELEKLDEKRLSHILDDKYR